MHVPAHQRGALRNEGNWLTDEQGLRCSLILGRRRMDVGLQVAAADNGQHFGGEPLAFEIPSLHLMHLSFCK